MTTREHPVVELLDLEIHNGTEWVRWTDPLRAVHIQRGGKRKGLTQSVDVGTLSCEFVNAGDPLVNENIVPEEIVAYDGFNTGPDGWTGGTWDDSDGVTTLNTTDTPPLDGSATKTFSGLTPGRTYTIRAFRSGAASQVTVNSIQTYAEAAARFATYGDAQAAAVVADPNTPMLYPSESLFPSSTTFVTGTSPMTYGQFEKTRASKVLGSPVLEGAGFALLEMHFTAVWSEHKVTLSTTAEGITRWDRVQIVRDAYAVETPELKPNQRVRIISGENIMWAGTTEDIASQYELDKNTGRSTAFVNLGAVDAVSAVAGVTRYGAVVEGGAGSETWPSRINRLATSAPASVTVEHVAEATDIVRYSLG